MAITQRERRRREILRGKIDAIRNAESMATYAAERHAMEARYWKGIAADERRKIRKLERDLAK